MDHLFPHHPCTLARESNPLRCGSLREAGGRRCAACREAMRDVAWSALVEGDRSLAQFVLADDALTERGFSVGDYRGEAAGDPVFALVRSKSVVFNEAGDCSIMPIPEGRYRMFVTLDEERDFSAECDDLAQASALLLRMERQGLGQLLRPERPGGSDGSASAGERRPALPDRHCGPTR